MNQMLSGAIAWKTISIGGGTPEALATKVAGICEVSVPETRFLMTKMTVVPNPGTVDLVVLTPSRPSWFHLQSAFRRLHDEGVLHKVECRASQRLCNRDLRS